MKYIAKKQGLLKYIKNGIQNILYIITIQKDGGEAVVDFFKNIINIIELWIKINILKYNLTNTSFNNVMVLM